MSEIRRDRTAAVGSIRRIAWGAIVAGTLLALAIQFMLGLLGLGIGLVSINAGADIAADAAAFASVAGLWTVAVVLIGLFLGAYTAARLAGSPDRLDALLHGVITWASATLVVIVLLTSSSSALIGGAFGAVGNSIQGLTQAAEAVAPQIGALPPSIRSEVDDLFRQAAAAKPATAPAGEDETEASAASQTAGTAAPAATGPNESSYSDLAAGLAETATQEDRQKALAVLTGAGALSPAAAEERLQAFQQRYDQSVRQAREAASAAASAVSSGAFGAFVSLLLGLIVGAAGGIVGKPRQAVYSTNS
ncbi:hypothetical protein [Aurantimonas sp. VKM B-3413]|uniref:hypothetical protein n=1 Tax=Aurantimonas sp. VKM B-3413 TaxID=2779401 RepID=UPI001E3903C2|nr:hypothetical protein [Aurantimonas sp. VKM B-3413]MCB8838945.1 hypothetical protein [Aurantimonas sp. VKM B-3413]